MASGVPLTSLKPGLNVVQTGPDGPSRAGDYAWPVSLDNHTALPADATIPPNTTVFIYIDPSKVNMPNALGTSSGGSPSAQTVEQGTQIKLDQASVDNTDAQTYYYYAQADQLKQNYNKLLADAQNQYNKDVAQFGLQVAQQNWNQRTQAAYIAFAQQAQQLSADQFNFNQRQAVANQKQSILQMLADRRGPQDWVAYDSLANGLNAPNPNKSTTLDPFSILDGLNIPTQATGANIPLPNASDVPTPASQAPFVQPAPVQSSAPATAAASASSGATVGPAPGAGVTSQLNAAQPRGVTTPNPTQPYPGLAPATPIPAANPAAGQAAANWMASANTPGAHTAIGAPSSTDLNSNQANPVYTSGGGSQIWNSATQRWEDKAGNPIAMAHGGILSGLNAAVVGDSPSGRPTGHEELAVSPTGAPIIVIPLHAAATGLAHMASGGVIGSYGADPNTINISTYDPSVLGSQPFYQKLTGRMPSTEFGGFGASLDNPNIGITNAPWNINLQAYNALSPSEQSATRDLYEQGLWTNFDDQLESAKRASPAGYSMGATRYAA